MRIINRGIIMTIEQLHRLNEQIKYANHLHDQIEQLKKEISILETATDDDIKQRFDLAFNIFVKDDIEWQTQKLLCKRIIDYAISYRQNKLRLLQKQLDELEL